MFFHQVVDYSTHRLHYVFQIPPDSGDIIVSKAIDIWQKHGSLLMPVVTKSELPGSAERAPS